MRFSCFAAGIIALSVLPGSDNQVAAINLGQATDLAKLESAAALAA